MGGFDQAARQGRGRSSTPNSPIVRVRGVAIMGGVTVVRKGPPSEQRKRLTR